MLRRGRFIASVGLLVAALAPQAAMAAPRSTTTAADPLAVTIDSMTPSALKPSGTVTVTGTITNTDDDEWTTVNVYTFIGWAPMTTSSQLAEAAASDPATPVGSRVITLGDFSTIDAIEPGQTVPYTVTVPRADLPVSTPGVYWFGIQALGQTEEGRDTLADGQARTFLPLVAAPAREPVKKHHKKKPLFPLAQREKVALVVPIRARVEHEPDGTIAGVSDWTTSLSHAGRLGSLLDLATAIPSSALLIDPAVVGAAQQLANGNPALLTVTADDDSDTDSDALDSDTAAAQSAASEWLDKLTTLAATHELLELPFGDMDLTGADDQSGLYAAARARSLAVFDRFPNAHITQVNAPTGGVVNATGLRVPTDDALTLLSDTAIADDLTETTPVRARIGATPLIVTSGGAAEGGPGPDDPLSPVALRQRILSEAAVRQPTQTPMVVVLPDDFAVGNATSFADGLHLPWVRLGDLFAVADSQPEATRVVQNLTYPDVADDAEVPAEAYAAAQRLIDAGTQLQDVVPDASGVATAALDTALSSVGYEARGLDTSEVDAATSAVRSLLDQISISVSPAVTLSSDSGHFSAVVTNGLDQPASVQLQAVSDAAIAFAEPSALKLGAHERATVLLAARADRNGVHVVRLYLTDTNGREFGTEAVLPVRVAQVSRVIWAFIIAGVALLAVAIAVRLLRRIRRARSAS